MRGYITTTGHKIAISVGRQNPPGLGRGLGVIPGPSIQQVTRLPLSPAPATVQQTLAQAYGPVANASFLSGLSAWAQREAISGTGITNGLLYGGAGFLLLIALLKGRRMF